MRRICSFKPSGSKTTSLISTTPESYSRIPVGDYILYKLGTLEVPDPDVAEFSYPVITPTTLLRSPGCVVANTETYYESVKIVEVKE